MENKFVYTKKNRYTEQKKNTFIIRLSLFFVILLLINIPRLTGDIEGKMGWKALNSPFLTILDITETRGVIENNFDGAAYVMAISIPNSLIYLLLLILLNKLKNQIKKLLHVD